MRGEAIAAYDADLPPGESFQASAAAVNAVHDGVRDSKCKLVARMAATSERMIAAALNYAAAEEASAAALRSGCCGA
jgi:hypothetical protein